MHKRNVFVSGRWASLVLVASAGYIVVPASAATLTMYVTDGAAIKSFTSTSSSDNFTAWTNTGDTYTLPTPSSGTNNAFDVVASSGGNIYVADAGQNEVLEYASTGGAVTHTLTIANDSSGVSPQEIALDSSGNLYVLSYGGVITEFPSSGAASYTLTTVANARGLVIDGTTVYVSTSGSGNAAGVTQFSITTPGTSGTTLVPSSTSSYWSDGNLPDGQNRGLAYNNSTLYLADSSWTAGDGYFEAITSANTGSLLGTADLDGPNALLFEDGNAGSHDYIFSANYFGDDVTAYNPGTGAAVTLTGLSSSVFGTNGVTGIAFGPSSITTDEIGADPGFFQDLPASATPEPGTFSLMLGTLLLALGIGIRAQRRQLQ
jgi:hypothetical protein